MPSPCLRGISAVRLAGGGGARTRQASGEAGAGGNRGKTEEEVTPWR